MEIKQNLSGYCNWPEAPILPSWRAVGSWEISEESGSNLIRSEGHWDLGVKGEPVEGRDEGGGRASSGSSWPWTR